MDGVDEGSKLGNFEGCILGSSLGFFDGEKDGIDDGPCVGLKLGC